LVNVKNSIVNCDIGISRSKYEDNFFVSIDSRDNKNIQNYFINDTNFESYDIKIVFNKDNEVEYVIDKLKEIYYYPIEQKKLALVIGKEGYKFIEVYFYSSLDDNIIHPYSFTNWDNAYFASEDFSDINIKHLPNSNFIFRIITKYETVHYINPFKSKELYEYCLKDYRDFILTNHFDY